MNELLPEGELFPEEIQFKLETLLRAKFLVEATNLITEVKTPWLSIFRHPCQHDVITAPPEVIFHGKRQALVLCPSLEKWLCSTASWEKLESDPCSHLSQDMVRAGEAVEPTQGTKCPQPSRARTPRRPPSRSSIP